MIASGKAEISSEISLSPEDLELQKIWKLVQQDDPIAFAELVDRFDSLLGVVIRERLGSEARRLWDTVDIQQVVWSSLYRRRHTIEFEDRHRFVKYLVAIARNRIVSACRKSELPMQADSDTQEPCSHDPTPSQVVAHRETLQRLDGVSDQAQIMVEQRQQGWTFKRIASFFGLNERTVRRRFLQLKERLTGQ